MATMSTAVPPLQTLDATSLEELLSLLFEPSPTLRHLLVPQVVNLLSSRPPPTSYAEVIHLCATASSHWTWEQKSDFISGHPEIGAPAVGLSGKEQGGGPVTPPVVLARLKHLNDVYRTVFPGLRFVTFVNGRPRAEIIPEMEEVIGIQPSPRPLPDGYSTLTPVLDSDEVKGLVRTKESEPWRVECDRGLADVWRIGVARLKTLGVE